MTNDFFAIHFRLTINYEKYFYAGRSLALESEQDKLVVEMMVRF